MIYNVMMREKGGYFEPQLLEMFFNTLGVWPIGTIVRLTDGRIAVVRAQNSEDLFFPKVEVIFPAEKKELIDLNAEKEHLKIEGALNPLGEGKEYLPLI
jgi:hypothetical protein